MILVDVNILVYARNRAAKQHAAALAWLDEQFNSLAPVALPWASLLGFLRVSTNPRAFERPLSMADAWDQVTSWLSAEPAWIAQPTERHCEVLTTLLAQPGIQGNLVSDAHLAALAIEHGLTLCSTDEDFARFKGLRWLNPMAG